jgi:hypothetical protein
VFVEYALSTVVKETAPGAALVETLKVSDKGGVD